MTTPISLEPAVAGLPTDQQSNGQRSVFQGVEHSDIAVPINLLFKHGKLDLYEEVVGRNLFQIQLKKDSLVLRAGAFVGLIPLNDEVYIEVRPRVPIGNFERLLLLSEDYTPDFLPSYDRNYRTSDTPTPSLVNMMCERLLSLLDQIHYEGLYYEYERTRRSDHSPSGKIHPYASTAAQIKTGDQFRVVSSSFRRTLDNAPNRCIRMAIRYLREIYDGTQRKGSKRMSSLLAQAETLFDRVRIDESMSFLNDLLLTDYSLLPEQRPAYPPALVLAKTLLTGKGINVRSTHGLIKSPSILVSMEQVFERYVRDILRRFFASSRALTLLDGNKGGKEGGAKRLFSEAHRMVAATNATPDIIVSSRKKGFTCLVLDAKYKICEGQPDRDDLNQALVYGVAYESLAVGLIYPYRRTDEPYVTRLGKVGSIEVYKLALDLSSLTLPMEEEAFATAVEAVATFFLREETITRAAQYS